MDRDILNSEDSWKKGNWCLEVPLRRAFSLVELEQVNNITKSELEVFIMLMFTLCVKVFLSYLDIKFPCSLCTKALYTLVVLKVLTILQQLKS